MQGTLLLAAAIHPDNTPHGYNLTFAFPMLMFIIVAGALYLRFRGTHRVPGHVALSASRWATAESGGAAPAGGATAPAASASADTEAKTTTAEQASSGEQSTEGGE